MQCRAVWQALTTNSGLWVPETAKAAVWNKPHRLLAVLLAAPRTLRHTFENYNSSFATFTSGANFDSDSAIVNRLSERDVPGFVYFVSAVCASAPHVTRACAGEYLSLIHI